MTSPVPSSARRSWTESGVGIIAVAIAAMWVIEVADSFLLSDRLQRGGIHPRALDGLDGILWAPFLHSDFRHLISNTAPALILGGLVSIRGLRYWTRASAAVLLVGGGFTWLLGGSGNHIGASGMVFGWFGVLLGAAIFERRPATLGAALVALLLYSGIFAGLAPQPQVSWEGHLFGLLAGIAAAKAMAEPRHRPGDVDNPQPWEADEPWR